MDELDIQTLRIFLEAAHTLNFTAAGRNLDMSQPAISMRIRDLEDHLQIKLFERSPKGLQLTTAGDRLVSRAKQIIELVVQTEESLRLEAGDVSISAVSMAKCEVYWRGTMLMAAIKLFQSENKQLPETLDNISKYITGENTIDPFSGNKFVYRTSADDFLLYSLGQNFKDDHGKGGHSFSGDGYPLLDPDIVIHRASLHEQE